MSDLLEVAVAAHGGLDRWNGITSIDVAASITGATSVVLAPYSSSPVVVTGRDATMARELRKIAPAPQSRCDPGEDTLRGRLPSTPAARVSNAPVRARFRRR